MKPQEAQTTPSHSFSSKLKAIASFLAAIGPVPVNPLHFLKLLPSEDTTYRLKADGD